MIAIVPARGGSKGVPGKNIKELGGKPLIHWTLEAAKKSNEIDKIILSTDSQEIVDVCNKFEIEVPFLRPYEFAQDDSLAIDNYIYTVNRLNKEFQYNTNEFVVLQPTSPFRKYTHLNEAIKLYKKQNADSLVSCCELSHPIEWVMSIDKNSKLKQKYKSDLTKNRQEFQKSYVPNGAIFILQLDYITRNRTYYSSNTIPFIMDEKYSLDIDTDHDFYFAETLINNRLI